MSATTIRRLAWSLALLSITVAMLGLGISILAQIANGGHLNIFVHQFFIPILAISYGVVGALVASRHPRNPIGWMFGAVGFLSALNILSVGYVSLDPLALTTGALPGVRFARWLEIWVWIPNMLLPVTFLLLLFPDGRLLSGRWRPIAWAAGVGTVLFILVMAFHPWPPGEAQPNPFGIPHSEDTLNTLMTITTPLLAIGVLGSLASVMVRLRSAEGPERAQLKWLAFACLILIVGNVAAGLVWWVWQDNPVVEELSIVITMIAIANIVIATGVAILRYRLWDIDILINRTLVYGSLTAVIVCVYIVIVGALGTLIQTSSTLPVSLAATGIVALSFESIRERVQRRVNRMMFGDRDDPYAILTRLAKRLEVVVASPVVLPTIVQTVAEALKLPYAAIALNEGTGFKIAAEYRRPSARARIMEGGSEILPLVYQSETMGQLMLAPRAPGEPFSHKDRQLLETIARQAGIAAYNVRLTLDLQRSRERLVTTREEERRRLRRDLHDGLGPVLAAASFKLDAVANLADTDSLAVRKLATDIKKQMQDALTDIRRIAYDLRPPALDELGLVGALREHIASDNEAQALQIALDAPESLPPLPAAVEVAAYRITLEALTNVSRHASARHCRVHLSLADALCLEISDDGRGLPTFVRAGVGFTSMCERAEELGGVCTVQAQAGGGTSVVARLPVIESHHLNAEDSEWIPSAS